MKQLLCGFRVYLNSFQGNTSDYIPIVLLDSAGYDAGSESVISLIDLADVPLADLAV